MTIGDARPRRALASPKARRIAAERGIDLDALAGSGPSGAIVAGDVERRHGGCAALSSLLADDGRADDGRSWQTTPHFYLRRDVDASARAGAGVARRGHGASV